MPRGEDVLGHVSLPHGQGVILVVAILAADLAVQAHEILQHARRATPRGTRRTKPHFPAPRARSLGLGLLARGGGDGGHGAGLLPPELLLDGGRLVLHLHLPGA